MMFALSWKLTAISAALAFMVGASSGAIVTAKFYKNAEYEAKIERLENDIKKRNDAAKKDAEQAVKDRAELDTMKEALREIETKISDGDCLTGDDTRWLHERFFKRQ